MAGCSACQRRRKLLLAKLAAKKAKGKRVQAAAIGAVLAATDAAGKMLPGGVSADQFAKDAAQSIADQIDSQLVGKLIGEEDGSADSGTTDPADGSGGTDRGRPGGSGV